MSKCKRIQWWTHRWALRPLTRWKRESLIKEGPKPQQIRTKQTILMPQSLWKKPRNLCLGLTWRVGSRTTSFSVRGLSTKSKKPWNAATLKIHSRRRHLSHLNIWGSPLQHILRKNHSISDMSHHCRDLPVKTRPMSFQVGMRAQTCLNLSNSCKTSKEQWKRHSLKAAAIHKLQSIYLRNLFQRAIANLLSSLLARCYLRTLDMATRYQFHTL